MNSPRKIAELLDKRLKAWRSVVAHASFYDLTQRQDFSSQFSYQSMTTTLEDLWNHELHLSDNYSVSYGTAVDDILTSRGRLLDVLEFIENCWPNRKSWCEKRRKDNTLSRILGRLWSGLERSELLQNALLLDDLRKFDENRDIEHRDEDPTPELEVLYAYRDAKARLAALREANAVLVQERQIDSIADATVHKHSLRDRGGVGWFAREYVFNERLYLWDENGLADPRIRRYRYIFDLANLSDNALNELYLSNLQNALRGLDLEGEQFEDTSRILSRIARFVQAFGYKHFLEDVAQDGGQWGPLSGIGSREGINVLPRGRRGACHPVVIGLASGRGKRAKGSLQNIMKDISEQMHHCLDVTKIAIVMTDIWDPSILWESMNDISLHKRHGKKFVFLLVNGRRLVPMNFSFS